VFFFKDASTSFSVAQVYVDCSTDGGRSPPQAKARPTS
jgi:hypothetical protein